MKAYKNRGGRRKEKASRKKAKQYNTIQNLLTLPRGAFQ